MKKQGHIEDFEKKVAFLKKTGADFKVEMSGMTRTILYLDAYGNVSHKGVYFGHRDTERMQGLELVTMVRRELKKRIDSGEKAPPHSVGTKVVAFHVPNCQNAVETGETLTEIDLNACYWSTAYKLGFISPELFEKGWAKRRQAKIGLLAAIGSLNKKTYTENYSFGQSEGIERAKKDDAFRPYYWAIINEVNNVMHDSIAKVPKHHFMMWLTDCIYVREESTSIIQEFFSELGYEFKTNSCHFSKVEKNRVYWVNHKTGEEKYVFFSKSVSLQ